LYFKELVLAGPGMRRSKQNEKKVSRIWFDLLGFWFDAPSRKQDFLAKFWVQTRLSGMALGEAVLNAFRAIKNG
jgi:hypothetical protein